MQQQQQQQQLNKMRNKSNQKIANLKYKIRQNSD